VVYKQIYACVLIPWYLKCLGLSLLVSYFPVGNKHLNAVNLGNGQT